MMEGISNYVGRLDEKMDVLAPEMARMTTGLLGRLAFFGIAGVLSVYILYDKEVLKRQMKRLYRAYMPEKIYTPVKHFILTALEVFDRFAAGQGMESLILGTLCFLGMFVLRLEYSGLVSLIVGMTAFIPLLGAYIGGGLFGIAGMVLSVPAATLIYVLLRQGVEKREKMKSTGQKEKNEL